MYLVIIVAASVAAIPLTVGTGMRTWVQLAPQLLDRQIVDADGLLLGKVDDVGFAFGARRRALPSVPC